MVGKTIRRLTTFVNSMLYRMTRPESPPTAPPKKKKKKQTTRAGRLTLLRDIILAGFHLSVTRKETGRNRHIGHFPSCPVDLRNCPLKELMSVHMYFLYFICDSVWQHVNSVANLKTRIQAMLNDNL